MELLFACLVIFLAYFLKGFSGFGPALVIIPLFTLLFDPGTAITTATLYDFLAGAVLLIQVRKRLEWNFVLPVFASLAFGAAAGSVLLGQVPVYWLKKIIGIFICVFAILILLQKNGHPTSGKLPGWPKYAVSGVGGFFGGFIGITGPPLIIYMKMRYSREYFRTQLIGVFFFGALWRFVLYRLNHIPMNLSLTELFVFLVVMGFALFFGSRLQVGMQEQRFNRLVAAMLLVPAINLVFFG